MAQPSVAQYFNNRKRSAVDEYKINNARKVLILDEDSYSNSAKPKTTAVNMQINGTKTLHRRSEIIKVPMKNGNVESQQIPKNVRTTKTKTVKKKNGSTIQTFLNNMKVPERCITPPNQTEKYTDESVNVTKQPETCITPPNCTVQTDSQEFNILKKKILKSSKLHELKASIKHFKHSAEQLRVAEKKTSEISHSPKLKTFKSIEFEVSVSPQKVQSPEKPYLSPKKESSVRKNLLTILSPTKQSNYCISESSKELTDIGVKQGLKLPFKYRTLTEIFRAADTISQMLYNRKELITLRKLKPAVEEMLKRNFTEKHLAQIKFVYPDAYNYHQEKIKQIGMRQEEWNLVITPVINNAESMTPELLLNRRRKFHEILINLVKQYHNEFLLSLTPPMVIDKDKITRWHPEFDLEKVPDIELAEIPKAPCEEKFTTGKEVLEKARHMFNCNTRMEQALAKLKAKKELPATTEGTSTQCDSVLKGIPKALLEKVRQKQAAKALITMTRSIDKDKEMQLYSKLPEIARLTRNLYVSEKKSVLQLDTVVEKLGNSYRSFLTKCELEDSLKAIAAEVPDWLVFHTLRNSVYLKLAKNADLSKVLHKLEKIAKEKSAL